jgi:hypothetical protein
VLSLSSSSSEVSGVGIEMGICMEGVEWTGVDVCDFCVLVMREERETLGIWKMGAIACACPRDKKHRKESWKER